MDINKRKTISLLWFRYFGRVCTILKMEFNIKREKCLLYSTKEIYTFKSSYATMKQGFMHLKIWNCIRLNFFDVAWLLLKHDIQKKQLQQLQKASI